MGIARISRSRRIYVNQGAISLEYKGPWLEAWRQLVLQCAIYISGRKYKYILDQDPRFIWR